MANKPRNYRKEYDTYHGTSQQKKNRASRNKARNTLKKSGSILSGKDVHHKDGNPKNRKSNNLKVTSKSKNRSFKRTKNARKKAPGS